MITNLLKPILATVLLTVMFSCKNKTENNTEIEKEIEVTKTDIKYSSHLFSQTNETENKLINFGINDDGTLTELERVATGGKGTNGFKAVTGETSAPDPLFSGSSVMVSKNKKYIYTTNGGNNSVSVFSMVDGKLKLIDNALTGEEGVTNSLAISEDGKTIYALHSFGPNHIKRFTMVEGKLALTEESYSVNTTTATDRIPTQINITPDGKHVLVNVIFNARPKGGDNGPILTPSNAGTNDGIVMFDIANDGQLTNKQLIDSGAPTPFSLRFLNDGTNNFINTFAAGNGAALSKFENGKIKTYPIITVDLTSAPKGPSETCWVSISGDKKYAFATSFGLGTVTSFKILEDGLELVKDLQATTDGGDGFAALAKIPTTGPCDNWMKGDYFYQIHGNAGKLIAYKNKEGILTEIGSYTVPRNSIQGLAGF